VPRPGSANEERRVYDEGEERGFGGGVMGLLVLFPQSGLRSGPNGKPSWCGASCVRPRPGNLVLYPASHGVPSPVSIIQRQNWIQWLVGRDALISADRMVQVYFKSKFPLRH
jgi:hypothetical protein